MNRGRDPCALSRAPRELRTLAIQLAYPDVSGAAATEEFSGATTGQGVHEQPQPGVRLPKEFQFNTDGVFVRKEGEDVILLPRPTDWAPYLDDGPVASDEFKETVEGLPVQERKA